MRATTPRRALIIASLIGTLLQLAMVITGHDVAFVKLHMFAAGGVGISLLAGVLYGRVARRPNPASAGGGSIAGGTCALIGILVSFALGDVTASVIAFGTISSAIAGAIGGAIAASP